MLWYCLDGREWFLVLFWMMRSALFFQRNGHGDHRGILNSISRSAISSISVLYMQRSPFVIRECRPNSEGNQGPCWSSELGASPTL